jgi:predicted RNase H-like HicB family nuclease
MGEDAMSDAATLHRVKVVIERVEDGYVAYPLGLKGVVVGQGDSYAEALDDVTSAIRAHVRTFGSEAIQADPAAVDAFVAEAEVRF